MKYKVSDDGETVDVTLSYTEVSDWLCDRDFVCNNFGSGVDDKGQLKELQDILDDMRGRQLKQ